MFIKNGMDGYRIIENKNGTFAFGLIESKAENSVPFVMEGILDSASTKTNFPFRFGER